MRTLRLIYALILAILRGYPVQLDGTARGVVAMGLLTFTVQRRAVAVTVRQYRPNQVYFSLAVA